MKASPTGGVRSHGADLMNRISTGDLRQAPSAAVEKLRTTVVAALEELFVVGARIRPLMLDSRQVGWVRGLHVSEHRLLRRWAATQDDLLTSILHLATTFSREDLNNMSVGDIRSLARLVGQMTEYDLSLYPYVAAFCTTSISGSLWASGPSVVSSWSSGKGVRMPDGATIELLAPSDHVRLWAALCRIREDSKASLDRAINSTMLAQVWVGDKATQMLRSLQSEMARYQPDRPEPWTDISPAKPTELNDGWAHSGVDDSVQGLMRELRGISSYDRHERVMAYLERRQRAMADAERVRVETLVAGKEPVAIENTPITEQQAFEMDDVNRVNPIPAQVAPET